jgi:secreted trypsin-like serine protease
MKRITLLLTVMATALLVASGVAWAVNKTCPPHPQVCSGTSGDAVLKSPSQDNMYGKGDNDTYTNFVSRNSHADLMVAADEQPSSASVSPMIVGGTQVPNGKYPFMAALLDKSKPGGAFQQQFCAGTLIDQDSVLTAAHCFFDPQTGAFERGINLQVVVGRTVINQNQGQLRSVSLPHRYIHPRYDGNRRGNVYDAAVLKLIRPVKGIKPIKLATARQNDLEKPGRILTAAGWGSVRSMPQSVEDYPKRMHEVSVPVVSDSRAKRAYQSLGIKYSPSLQVAAGKKGKSACFGDSGGPLFDSGSRTQVGITSGGAPGGCGRAHYPVVYTEVNNTEIGKWILRAAKR